MLTDDVCGVQRLLAILQRVTQKRRGSLAKYTLERRLGWKEVAERLYENGYFQVVVGSSCRSVAAAARSPINRRRPRAQAGRAAVDKRKKGI